MSIFVKNLEILSKRNQDLAIKVARLDTAYLQQCEVVSTVEGVNSLRFYDQKTKKKVFIHSRYRPLTEAARATSVLNLKSARLFGVVGFGAGYYLNEVLKQTSSRAVVIVFEPNPEILRAAMEVNDLTTMLASRRLIIMDAAEPDFEKKLVEKIRGLISLTNEVEFFLTPAYATLFPECNPRLRTIFFDTITYLARRVGSGPEDSLYGLEHLFENILHQVKSSDLASLEGKYVGVPAFCVAAGPSLNKNIGYLKQAQGKSLIICADTILERLLFEGVIPDLVGVLERDEIIYDYFFKGKNYPPDVTLAGQGVINPEIFNNFPGKKVVCLKKGLPPEDWLKGLLSHIASFPCGDSVAHMNFSLARYLGCNPIILVGQDLAYGEGRVSHAEGTVHTNNWKEKKEEIENCENDFILGKNGQMLPTQKWWKIFHRWFELEIASTRQQCIDATEGGALIRGTQIMPLKNVVEEFCLHNLSSKFRDCLSTPDDREIYQRLASIESGVTNEIDKLEETKKTIKKGKQALEHFQEQILIKNESNINGYLVPVNECINQIIKQNLLFFFLAQSLYINLGRQNSTIGKVNSRMDCQRWSDFQGNFLADLDGIGEITGMILNKGLALTRAYLKEYH